MRASLILRSLATTVRSSTACSRTRAALKHALRRSDKGRKGQQLDRAPTSVPPPRRSPRRQLAGCERRVVPSADAVPIDDLPWMCPTGGSPNGLPEVEHGDGPTAFCSPPAAGL